MDFRWQIRLYGHTAHIEANVGGCLICILSSRCQSVWTSAHKAGLSDIQNRGRLISNARLRPKAAEKHWSDFCAGLPHLHLLRLSNFQRGSQSQLTRQIPLLWHRKTWVDKAGVEAGEDAAAQVISSPDTQKMPPNPRCSGGGGRKSPWITEVRQLQPVWESR